MPPDITLGTVQLGMAYGFASRNGRPDDAETAAILQTAMDAGIARWDTARIYGDAEERIGDFLVGKKGPIVVTKLAPFAKNVEDEAEVAMALDASIAESCRALRRMQLDVVMFHRSADMFKPGAMAHLAQHVAEGRIGAIGASVYNPSDAAACIADARVTHIQLPFNILDTRWLGDEFQIALTRRSCMQVHVRSVFLQGLLVGLESIWPAWLDNSHAIYTTLDRMTKDFGRENRRDLCLSYVRSFPWITSIVIGVHRAAQLREILALAKAEIFTTDQRQAVEASFGRLPERLLTPSQW